MEPSPPSNSSQQSSSPGSGEARKQTESAFESESAVPLGALPGQKEPFRQPPAFRIRQFFRRNFLVGLSTAFFLAAGILILIQIDRVYYNQEKTELIGDLIFQRRLEFEASAQRLERLSQSYTINYVENTPDLASMPPPERRSYERKREEALAQVSQAAQLVLEENPFVWRISMSDQAGGSILVVDDPRRQTIQNSFDNCLFIRNFSASARKFKGNDRGAQLVIEVTSPRNVREIEELTSRWRLISAFILGGLFLVYGAFLWGAVLPMRNVIKALDKGAAVGSPIIPRPGMLLEKYYNNLARDATLSIFSTGLRQHVSEKRVADQYAVMDYGPRLIMELFPVRRAEIWNFHREEVPGPWERDRVFPPLEARKPDPDFEAYFTGLVESNPPGSSGSFWQGRFFDYFDEKQSDRMWFGELLLESETSCTFLVVEPHPFPSSMRGWWLNVFDSVAREVRFVLRTVTEQQRLILQEKSKANISLSRNIGHDLTNIIATSKLELMTVKTLLEMPREEVYASPAKQEIFRESLEALLDNTRFLQETVNLYRSFTYLSRPKFEETDLNKLIRDVCSLFQLSLSKSIAVRSESDQSLAPIKVEPRLMRLALFNLMSNAADSIKRVTDSERLQGEIVVRTARERSSGAPQIIVEDDGGGLRRSDGELMEPHEIDSIFKLGFTTKDDGSGEGLGLSWVSQIVREFHEGELAARNRPEGGARLIITLPEDPAKAST